MENNNKTKQTVYISFNINDSIISSFISYLVAALNSQGIDAVCDKTGHNLESSQFANIKLFVLVFSKSYVACLEYLVKLLEFVQEKGHVVVPVFYDAVVDHQLEMFSKAFSVLKRSYSAEQVTNWERVLAETMKLPGHVYTDELRGDYEFIEIIVKDIAEKFNTTEHIAIHRMLPELENLLSKQAWGFRSIGILGEEGMGKTKLAEAFFRRTSRGYDDSRFVKNFNGKIFKVWSEEDFKKVPMEKFDLNDEDDEPYYRLKRVLIVLDGVCDAQNVDALLSGFRRFGPGSLLIITSRDRQVLEKCHVNEIYELKGDHEDAHLSGEKLPKLPVSAIKRTKRNLSIYRSYAEIITGKRLIGKEPNLSWTYQKFLTCTEKKKSRFGLQATRYNFTITRKQPFLFEKLGDLKDLYLDHGSLQNSSFCVSSSLKDLCRLNDRISPYLKTLPTIDQRIQLGYQLNKLLYKSFSRLKRIEFENFKKLIEVEAISEACNLEEIDLRDCTSLERIPVTDQLKHLQILNLSGCTGIEHFPESIRTIPKLILEGTGIIEIRCEEKGFSKLAKQQRTTTLEVTSLILNG